MTPEPLSRRTATLPPRKSGGISHCCNAPVVIKRPVYSPEFRACSKCERKI